MTKLEYFEMIIGKKFPIELSNNIELINNYFDNKDKIDLEYNNYSIFDVINYFDNPDTFFDEFPFVSVKDEKLILKCNNKQLSKYAASKISNEVSELSCPIEVYKYLGILDFKNLKKLRITDFGKNSLKKQELEFILGQLPIEEFAIDGKFDQEILKDACFIKDFSNIYGNYKNKYISSSTSSNAFLFRSSFDGYSSNPYGDIDKFFDLIKKQDSENCKELTVFNDLEFDNKIYSLDVRNKKLEIYEVNDVKDIISFISKIVDNGFELKDIEFKIENKTYENMEYLKSLDSKYNVVIKYNNSVVESNCEDFIAMRAAIDYYKQVILENNLSPLEKITFAYDLIKSFVYNESDLDTDNSRYIHNIVRTGNIVCVGYATFFAQLVKELGFDSYAYGTSVPLDDGKIAGHERSIVKIDDDKYGVHGNYVFDPTWDSAKAVVMIVDKEGKTKFVSSRKYELKEGERILKEYDDMDLYRHFLVTKDKLQKVFPGERYPFLYNSDYYGKSKGPSFGEININISNVPISIESFIRLIKIVKEAEGFYKEDIDKVVKDILEVNYLENKQQHNELDDMLQNDGEFTNNDVHTNSK